MTKENALTKEQSFFLKVLRAYFSETAISVPENMDMALLAKISEAQQMASFVYYQTGIADLKAAFAQASYYVINRAKLAEQINQTFQKGQIPYIIVKGSEIAQYYRHPHLRISGDMDILVRPSDKEKAGAALESLGFKALQSTETDYEQVYIKGNYEVELHHRLLYDDLMSSSALTAFTDTVWEHISSTDGSCYHMEPEFHFVFLLLHLRKHLLWTGIGIRPFFDLAMMIKSADLDFRKIETYLDACGITLFARTCFSLIERWFDIHSPIESLPITEDFYSSASNAVLSGNTFGDMSNESLINSFFINSVRKNGRVFSSLSVVFPGWEEMREKYPAMGRHKILLPFLWIRRMIDSLFSGRAMGGLSYAGRFFKIGKQKKEHEKNMNSWGL